MWVLRSNFPFATPLSSNPLQQHSWTAAPHPELPADPVNGLILHRGSALPVPYYCVKCAGAGHTWSGAPTSALALVITVASAQMRHIQMAQTKVTEILTQNWHWSPAHQCKCLWRDLTHTHTHQSNCLMFESANWNKTQMIKTKKIVEQKLKKKNKNSCTISVHHGKYLHLHLRRYPINLRPVFLHGPLLLKQGET